MGSVLSGDSYKLVEWLTADSEEQLERLDPLAGADLILEGGCYLLMPELQKLPDIGCLTLTLLRVGASLTVELSDGSAATVIRLHQQRGDRALIWCATIASIAHNSTKLDDAALRFATLLLAVLRHNMRALKEIGPSYYSELIEGEGVKAIQACAARLVGGCTDFHSKHLSVIASSLRLLTLVVLPLSIVDMVLETSSNFNHSKHSADVDVSEPVSLFKLEPKVCKLLGIGLCRAVAQSLALETDNRPYTIGIAKQGLVPQDSEDATLSKTSSSGFWMLQKTVSGIFTRDETSSIWQVVAITASVLQLSLLLFARNEDDYEDDDKFVDNLIPERYHLLDNVYGALTLKNISILEPTTKLAMFEHMPEAALRSPPLVLARNWFTILHLYCFTCCHFSRPRPLPLPQGALLHLARALCGWDGSPSIIPPVFAATAVLLTMTRHTTQVCEWYSEEQSVSVMSIHWLTDRVGRIGSRLTLASVLLCSIVMATRMALTTGNYELSNLLLAAATNILSVPAALPDSYSGYDSPGSEIDNVRCVLYDDSSLRDLIARGLDVPYTARTSVPLHITASQLLVQLFISLLRRIIEAVGSITSTDLSDDAIAAQLLLGTRLRLFHLLSFGLHAGLTADHPCLMIELVHHSKVILDLINSQAASPHADIAGRLVHRAVSIYECAQRQQTPLPTHHEDQSSTTTATIPAKLPNPRSASDLLVELLDVGMLTYDASSPFPEDPFEAFGYLEDQLEVQRYFLPYIWKHAIQDWPMLWGYLAAVSPDMS